MKTLFNLDQSIENLVAVTCGPNAGVRQQHICREMLRSMARLAVAENAMNSKKDLDKTIELVESCEHA